MVSNRMAEDLMARDADDREPPRRRGRLPALLSVAVLAAGGLAVAGCGDDDEEVAEEVGDEPVQVEEGAEEATLSEILENTDEFIGQEVTVTGEVQDVVVDPGVFTLGEEEEGPLGAEEEQPQQRLVVLVRSGVELQPGEVAPGTAVRVQGTVQRVSPDIEREDEFLFQEDEEEEEAFLVELEGEPAILATQVDVNIPEEEQAAE